MSEYRITDECDFSGTSDWDSLHVEVYQHGQEKPEISLTCKDAYKRNYPGEESVYLTPQTARELAAYLVTLADKLEGKAE